MPKYAQIDISTGRCIGISFLSGEVEADNMIPLTDENEVNLDDTYENGVWIPAPPPEPVPIGESDSDKITRLEAENVQLRARDAQMQDDTSFILEALINAGLI